MNAWNAASSPVQATPTKSTRPSHRCAAASTEDASALQIVQVGAQNQNATGRPAMAAPLNSPPPTSGAEKFKTAGTPSAPPAAVLASEPEPEPHPAMANSPRRASVEAVRRRERMRPFSHHRAARRRRAAEFLDCFEVADRRRPATRERPTQYVGRMPARSGFRDRKLPPAGTGLDSTDLAYSTRSPNAHPAEQTPCRGRDSNSHELTLTAF